MYQKISVLGKNTIYRSHPAMVMATFPEFFSHPCFHVGATWKRGTRRKSGILLHSSCFIYSYSFKASSKLISVIFSPHRQQVTLYKSHSPLYLPLFWFSNEKSFYFKYLLICGCLLLYCECSEPHISNWYLHLWHLVECLTHGKYLINAEWIHGWING